MVVLVSMFRNCAHGTITLLRVVITTRQARCKVGSSKSLEVINSPELLISATIYSFFGAMQSDHHKSLSEKPINKDKCCFKHNLKYYGFVFSHQGISAQTPENMVHPKRKTA